MSKRQLHRSGDDEEDVLTHDEKDGTDQLPKSERQRVGSYASNEDADKPQFLPSGEINPSSAKFLNAQEIPIEKFICVLKRKKKRQAMKLEDDKQRASYKACAEDSGLKDQLFKVKTFDLRGGTRGTLCINTKIDYDDINQYLSERKKLPCTRKNSQ
ncbi:hypothetical protein GH714_000930 [Hevea brasiliensis]|uniref:Uncharacterized protein n=1 Tax=Hevea brasiliensis TaxID=3981 RepID=A0A6A6NAR8_HEVBR|nr:hypothetical protein GH714_000930 [Hevea brasiliensis]